jgi:Ca2+-binding RTX toxin-like protein
MHRLCILLAVMVVMVGALFAGQDALAKVFAGNALAKVFAGTGGDDTLVGTDRADSFTGRDGEDRLKGSRGNDQIFPGEDNDKVYGGAGKDLIYARDTDGEDYIDCGAGFDKVETIHRPDETLHNCERAPGPDRGNI